MVFGTPARAGWLRKDVNTIRLEGDIDSSSYKEYLSVSKDGFSVVELQSFGGYPNISLKIAEEIIKTNATIKIDGYCFSACANYLAFSGKSLFVPCDALLGWHGSPSLESDIEAARRFKKNKAPEKLADIYIKWLTDFRKRELTFFQKKGIDPLILNYSVNIPNKYVKSKPSSTFTFDYETGEYSLTETTIATLWIPSSETLARYGVNTDGFCNNYNDIHINNLIKSNNFKFNYSTRAR